MLPVESKVRVIPSHLSLPPSYRSNRLPPFLPVESKKDPGIPNLWPFKEKLLNQIEESKVQVREMI